jgi:toxin HigB-1
VQVICSFRHRGLRLFFERGDHRLIRTDLVDRIEVMLAQLDVAATVEAVRIPNYRLHALKGDLKGYWSVTVKGNWRIVFRFEDGNVHNVELIDYH